MEGEDPVLAFLLGSAPSLNAKTSSDPPTSDDDDTPMLESVSDSDAAASDWDAVTSCESDDETVAQAPTAEEKRKRVADNWKCNVETERKSAEETEQEDDREVHKPLHEKNKQRSVAVEKGGKKSKARRGSSVESPTKTEGRPAVGNVSTLEEVLFVGCVATVLVAYLVACVYSFFHPLSVPLPAYEGLYSAYDISNVSVQIVNPVENALVTPQGVSFEWKLVNFPVEALDLYGAEVFRYCVSIDDEVIATEVGFLALDGEQREPMDEMLNRTVHLPIPLRKFERGDAEAFKLHLEVTIPIPGLIGELKTYEQDVFVRKPEVPSPEDRVQLTLTAPADGSIFDEGQSFVLEYTAVNVQEMHVYVDDNVFFKKTHVGDGNLLVRGLGVKPHTLEVRALDEQGEIVASSTVHVEITKRSGVKAG